MTTQTITRFAAWRREVGLSQQQAADLLGVSKSIIADWDAGAVRGRGTPIEPPRSVQIAMGVYRVHGRIPVKYTRDA